MARTTRETANILIELYDESFAKDSYEQFRINWADLRGIAGVEKLTHGYLFKINQSLNRSGCHLIILDNFLVVTQESDMEKIRLVPPRVVEEYLYEEEEDEDDPELDDEDEEPEATNPEDCEVDDEDVESA